MMSITGEAPDHDISSPLRTDADVLRRVDFCVGDRSRRSLWLLFIGPDGVQLPVLVPVSDIPESPEPGEIRGLCHMIAHIVADSVADGTAVITLVRPGTGTLTDPDRHWCRSLHTAAAEEGAAIRMVCLATTDGVRQLTLDDTP